MTDRADRGIASAPAPAVCGGGTGSNPKPPSGWQRTDRRAVSQAAARGAVRLDGLAGVLRARRDVPARRRSVSGQPLVEVDHLRSRARVRRGALHGVALAQRAGARSRRTARVGVRSLNGARSRGGPTRSGPPPGTSSCRRRRARRHGGRGGPDCAPRRPTERPTAYATRGGSDPVHATAHVTITPRRRRRPSASARNVDRSRIGQIRPTGGSGPWPGGGEAPRDRLRVRIRRRKPCFFFRLRLFGWNVLFTHGLLAGPPRGWGALSARVCRESIPALRPTLPRHEGISANAGPAHEQLGSLRRRPRVRTIHPPTNRAPHAADQVACAGLSTAP